ncbi:MAG: hypothetical protein U0793_26895 [Gemmataceae bacterium]
MDPITFRCTTCDHALKVGADKAGRKVKCNRCNALLVVPAATEKKEEVVAAAPAKNDDDEPNDGKGYGLLLDPKEEEERKRREEEEKRARKKKKDEPLAKIQKRVKTIYDADDWKKVNIGYLIVLVALGFWGLQFAFHEISLLAGLVKGPEYSVLVDKVLLVEDPDGPRAGRAVPIDRMGFAMSLVYGSSFLGGGKIFFILGQVFLLAMGGMFIAAYGFFAKVPNRFGSRGMLKGMMVLGIINVSIGIIGKLLPMAVNFGPALIPLVAPEVALTAANVERALPLHVFWMHSPFWETFICLLAQLTFWVELILIGVFIWNCGKILQEEYIEQTGRTLSELAGGVYFIEFAYLMMSIAGASDVLVATLRVMYMVWIGFFVGYLIYFAVNLNNCRLMIEKLVNDTLAEEKKTGKKKRMLKLAGGDEEDEDEYDDEDDYDDDEDEDEDD